MKIGFMGGSFDPVHCGHLILADQLINEAGLDKLIFVPSFVSSNPSHEMQAEPEDRAELLRLATAGDPRLEISDIELRQKKLCFMDEDMESFRRLYPDDELYILTGHDAFMRIEKWHNYEKLLCENRFLIGKRPGSGVKELFALLRELLSRFKGLSVEFFDIPELDISSYQLQGKLRAGRSVKYLMPEACESYIKQHNLYGSLVPRLREFVKANVKPSRFEHTKGVVDTAIKLAVRYDVDPKKAEIAAWFHDAYRSAGNLEHGPLAAEKIQELFGVHDADIIEAIRNHTTGHPDMSELEKVIYVADSLEPSRVYPYVDELRRIMYAGLDECLYELMVHTREYVVSIGSNFDPRSDEAIKELKEKLGKQ